MKSLIKKLLREGLEESIKLGLSKELRNLWDNEELDHIFGKNVYRLYYDLDSGEQITPTRKTPSIKMDIPNETDFKESIKKYLNKYDFEVKDFDTNQAINTKNGQTIKITKILSKINKELTKKYTTYLDSISDNGNNKKDNNKLCVVISRHPHDLASKSAKPKWSSCEDLRHTTNLFDGYWEVEGFGKDPSKIKTNKNKFIHSGESGIGPTIDAILRNHLIFYLIDYGDWNIDDPHARLLHTKLCTQDYVDTWAYGDSRETAVDQTKFYEFKYKWVNHFAKKYGNKDKKELSDQEIINFINKVDNITPPITNQANDIMMSLVEDKKHLLNEIIYESLLIGIEYYYGKKVLKDNPEITNIIKQYVNKIYEDIVSISDVNQFKSDKYDDINIIRKYKDVLQTFIPVKKIDYIINTFDNLDTNSKFYIDKLKRVFYTHLDMMVNAGIDKEEAKKVLLSSDTFMSLKGNL